MKPSDLYDAWAIRASLMRLSLRMESSDADAAAEIVAVSNALGRALLNAADTLDRHADRIAAMNHGERSE